MFATVRLFFVLAVCLVGTGVAFAEKKYDPGASDTEIKIGQTMPYSGPASAFGWIGKAQAAVLAKLNEESGINGRKIRLISLDDGYAPPKTMEQTRKLVEEDNVLFLYQGLGTATQTAVQKYLNQKAVPQLFLASGAMKWGDPKNSPWTMMWQPPFQHEAHIMARYVQRHMPNAKVAILFQNDDFGKDILIGIHDGFGEKHKQFVVAEVSYEVTDPTVDSQIISLKATGADVVMLISTPKASAQAIRKMGNLGWKPTVFTTYASSSVELVLKPAGLDSAKGIISSAYLKDPSDPALRNDKEVLAYLDWVKTYLPDANPYDLFVVYGYANAHTLAYVLRKCGDELTRENVMRQATRMSDVVTPMLLPGIKLNTGAADYFPIEQLQLMRFDGERWVRFGELLSR